MESVLHNIEDRDQIIGTPFYEPFQQSLSLCGDIEVYKARKAGAPITGIEDGYVVTEYPDGHKERIAPVKPRVPITKQVVDISELHTIWGKAE